MGILMIIKKGNQPYYIPVISTQQEKNAVVLSILIPVEPAILWYILSGFRTTRAGKKYGGNINVSLKT